MAWPELELRWVLLGLGLLVVVGVYLGGVFAPRSRRSDEPRAEPELRRSEANAGGEWLTDAAESKDPIAGDTESGAASVGETTHDPLRTHVTPNVVQGVVDPERVVSLRLMRSEDEALDGERAVAALQEAGLQLGPYNIFHYPIRGGAASASVFSVANLVEPGSFDLSNLVGSTIPGMTFFLALPGSGDPVRQFDKMVDIARGLAQSLDAGLFDELGNSWSIQRERYVREELIEYRHRQSRG